MGNGKTAGSKKSTKKPIAKRRAPAMKTSKARPRMQTLARSKNASETVSSSKCGSVDRDTGACRQKLLSVVAILADLTARNDANLVRAQRETGSLGAQRR
jgi:hypothetical protein